MTQIRPEDEVVTICQELIRIDSSNYGTAQVPANGRRPNTPPA